MRKIAVYPDHIIEIETKYKKGQKIVIYDENFFPFPTEVTIDSVKLKSINGMYVYPEYHILTENGILPGLNEIALSRLEVKE